MIDFTQALVLGVVEGLTEFLPISSTAHLILVSKALGITQSDFVKTFEIAIQSGAILAVLALYFREFFKVEVLKRIIVAFIPTGVVGLVLYKIIKVYLIGNIAVVLWALAIGGVLMIIFERFPRSGEGVTDISALTYKQCLAVGLCQSVAVIPGVSRSAATIVGGLMLGVSREAIVKFSFLLAVPTMVAATGFDILKNYTLFDGSSIGVLVVGFFAAFVTAIIAIKFLLSFVRNHTFTGFGVYRIALVLFCLLAMGAGFYS